jgi:23S rRNA (uracil1939-C5)-methyltransferase
VIKASSFCRHADRCGGCGLLHLTYAEQVSAKTAALRARLSAAIGVNHVPPVQFAPVFAFNQPPRGFRQKVAFVFGTAPDGRGLVMGHYARGSQTIVPVTECPVHSDRGNRVAFTLRDFLAEAGLTAAGSSRAGVLRHLLVRTSRDDAQAVAMLVVTRNDKALRKPVRALLDSADRPDGFFLNINDRPGPLMVGPDTIRIGGERHVRETLNGTSYLVSPAAFFQTNSAAAEALQRLVVDGLSGASRVLDLYCGSGLFALALAQASTSTHVVGVEENPQAIRDAEANMRLNRIGRGRARLICARAEQALSRLARERWDAVVLDPPRQGCPPAVIQAVFARIRPLRAVYVSCNSDALADELPAIARAGYQVDEVRAVDMFPHTDHIEAVVRLSRA